MEQADKIGIEEVSPGLGGSTHASCVRTIDHPTYTISAREVQQPSEGKLLSPNRGLVTER